MIFYRVNSHEPFLVATQVDAKREAREAGAKWEQVDVPTDKAGLMAYVNELLRHQSYLVETITSAAPPEPNPPIPVAVQAFKAVADFATSSVHQSVAIDEAWEALPLARKLDLASSAMLEAREVFCNG